MNAEVVLLSDISYSGGPGKLDVFDLYVPRHDRAQASSPPLICFIHGGAWRSGDKADHHDLAIKLASRTRCAVAVPNYRLTPKKPTAVEFLHHPAHAHDILQFLQSVPAWTAPEDTAVTGKLYDSSKIYLIGHSCGAHMLTSIVLDSSAVTPELTPSASILQSVKGIAMSEGIYDIDALLSSFPDYREWFIDNAFGKRESYADVSSVNFPLRKGANHIRWLVIHSPQDTLVDLRQSEAIRSHLIRLYGDTHPHVTAKTEGLVWDHDQILDQPDYVDLIEQFISADSPN